MLPARSVIGGEATGPVGAGVRCAQMRTFDELEALWAETPPPPRDAGTVQALCVRREHGIHDSPDEITLTPAGGIDGDLWHRIATEDAAHEYQVTLMNAAVAELVAAGMHPIQEAGDNVYVDFDIGQENLPAGSRVRIGEVTLEVGEKPHTGCSKFAGRFGQDALRWVNWRHHRDRRLRGVNCRVVEGGTVRVGDPVTPIRSWRVASS
jgi:MOSC domain